MKIKDKTKFKNADFIEGFGDNSIFINYLKKTVLIIVIPFIVMELFVYLYISLNNKSQINLLANNTFIKSGKAFENAFESIIKQEYALMTNSDIHSMILLENAPEDSQNFQKYLMSNAIMTSSYIQNIDIYSTVSKYVFSTEKNGWTYDFTYLPWYEHYLDTGDVNFVISYKSSKQKSNYDRLSVVQGIFFNKKLYGIIACNIKIDELAEQIKYGETVDETYYIINSDGVVLYSDNQYSIKEKLPVLDSFEESDYGYLLYNSGNEFFCKYALPIMGTSLVVRLDLKNTIYHNTFILILILFMTGILMIIIAFLLSIYLSKHYYSAISEIVAYLQNDFIFNRSEGDNQYSEISFIKNSVFEIKNSNKILEKQLGENMERLKKAQSSMLQFQFNPHFLFNTLNIVSLKAISLTHSENDVSRIVKLLSELMRISLRTESYFTSVNEELSFAKKYLEIEGIRYNNDFEIEWNIEDGIGEFRIVKLILQPIMENAFKHGLRMLPNNVKKKIIISAFTEESNIVFSIANNGVGDKSKMETVQAELENDEFYRTNHIGMRNVNSRIKLLFGYEYGCTIERKNDFTIVRIMMPIIRNEDGEKFN